jgi:hypothetical protein
MTALVGSVYMKPPLPLKRGMMNAMPNVWQFPSGGVSAAVDGVGTLLLHKKTKTQKSTFTKPLTRIIEKKWNEMLYG